MIGYQINAASRPRRHGVAATDESLPRSTYTHIIAHYRYDEHCEHNDRGRSFNTDPLTARSRGAKCICFHIYEYIVYQTDMLNALEARRLDAINLSDFFPVICAWMHLSRAESIYFVELAEWFCFCKLLIPRRKVMSFGDERQYIYIYICRTRHQDWRFRVEHWGRCIYSIYTERWWYGTFTETNAGTVIFGGEKYRIVFCKSSQTLIKSPLLFIFLGFCGLFVGDPLVNVKIDCLWHRNEVTSNYWWYGLKRRQF